MIIESIMKGLAIWLYNLLLDIVEFIADALLDVFNMDMTYFESNVPVTREIITIILAAGWAILIGNLAFQAMKSMMSGIGFEGEDPHILFTRTFVFAFLLVASRQICAIGLNMTKTLNTLLQTPNAVSLGLPQLDIFSFPGSWLLVIIIGVILMFQLVRFFFEMAERYVVLVILTLFAPLAFGVGGSKNTEAIFKGWARMYGSACLMMVFNTVFLKLLLSAMSNMPGGTLSTVALVPWSLLVVGIARVARKIDDIVARIGLNTARTGENLNHGGLMYPLMMVRSLSGIVGKTIGGASKVASSIPKAGSWGGGIHLPPISPPSSGPTPAGGGGGSPSPSGSGGGSAASPPPSGPSSVPGGASSPGMDNNAQPTRPPLGFQGGSSGRGRDRNQAPEQSQQATESEQPKIFGGGGTSRGGGAGRSSAQGFRSQGSFGGHGEFGGHGTNNSNNTAGPRSGGGRSGRAENGESQPTLSADTRTPGASATPGSNSDAKGYQGGGRYKKKPNIDIYRDDDPPVRPTQSSRSASNGTHPVNTQGGTARPSSITPPTSAGTAAGSVRPAGKPTGSDTKQAGTTGPQMPSAPMNAASPRGGRISGGVTDPAGSHRVPSKATPSTQSGNTGASSATQTGSTQTHRTQATPSRINRSNSTTGTARPQGMPSSPADAGTRRISPAAPSALSSIGGQSESRPARYKVADRSTRKTDRPSREQDNKDERPPPGNRSTPPPPRGRPLGGNPATRR